MQVGLQVGTNPAPHRRLGWEGKEGPSQPEESWWAARTAHASELDNNLLKGRAEPRLISPVRP